MIRDEFISAMDISPTLLYTFLYPEDYGHTMESFSPHPLRKTSDYEIAIYLTEGGTVSFEGNSHYIKRGLVHFRLPGQHVQATSPPYNCYCVVIDMTGKTTKSRENYLHGVPQQAQVHYNNPILQNIAPFTMSDKYERLIYIFEEIHKEFKTNWPHTPLILRSYILEIIYILYADAITKDYSKMGFPIRYHSSVRKAIEYINANLADKLTLTDISTYVGQSNNYISRLFTSCIGINLTAYILNTRLQKSKELLIYTHLRIWEIAHLCGFESQSYFISVFKKRFQITPNGYRMKYR